MVPGRLTTLLYIYFVNVVFPHVPEITDFGKCIFFIVQQCCVCAHMSQERPKWDTQKEKNPKVAGVVLVQIDRFI